jgi:hypothetical protein
MKGIEGVRELQAAAADVGMIRRDQLDVRVGVDRGPGLGRRLPGDEDLVRKDQRPRALA